MNSDACVNFTFVNHNNNKNNNGLRVPKGEINFMLSTIYFCILENKAPQQDESKTEKKRKARWKERRKYRER